jgi:phenylacetate-CoA ligase
MCANQKIEMMSREAMTQLQMNRLKKTVRWAYDKSTFYHNKLTEAGVTGNSIVSLEDIRKLPFTTQADIIKTSPFEFLTIPLSGVLRLQMQERPEEIIKAYTNGDIARNIEMMSRVLSAAGIVQGSIVGILEEYSNETALDIQYALELLGATVIPLGVDFNRAVKMFDMFGIDTIVSDPQNILQLVIRTQALGKDIMEYPLSRVFCLNNSIQNPMQKHIGERISASVYNLYVSRELGYTGVLFQCGQKHGFHVQEDCFYPEIIEFGGTEPVKAASQMGELVLTTIVAEAMPILRYRTGQAVNLLPEPCACGRELIRIATPFDCVPKV